MSRGGFKIEKLSDDETYSTYEKRVDWLDAFAAKAQQIAPNAVEAARQRDAQSIIDQISNIMGNKVEKTVASIVDDYQNKTGLKAYLKRMSDSQEAGATKTAQEAPLSQIFDNLSETDKEDILTFVRNKCESSFGGVQVPALVEEVSSTFKQRGLNPQDVNNPIFEKFISDEIVRAKKMFPQPPTNTSNLGKVQQDELIAPDKINMYEM